MTHTAPAAPIARFVIERRPGKGYMVTCAEGERAEEWSGRSLTLLDLLGQPDPIGPDVTYRLVGPLSPSGEYVGVVIRKTLTGEAIYEQTWFLSPGQAPGAAPTIRGRLVSFLFGIVIVVVLGLGYFIYSERASRDSSAELPKVDVLADPPSASPPTSIPIVPDPQFERLWSQLSKSQNIRRNVLKYLSQEGLYSKPSEVVEPKQSVKLVSIAEKDPEHPILNLDTVEVTILLELLRSLEDVSLAAAVSATQRRP